ncbi:hypothetical protein QN372_16190 [Undibacterium sp. RTI2.1]|uniref:hypothetical protein n=1 Tax=unclassified Undibacterium TaxID=2630295 RepID=UPI002AB36A36|nr:MULTISPECIES: hypothetical protein [unclassified Undibacterium]MDY7540768.1 hypothetical protein [Undibacterium sp. 5I1]MEB0032299.1 hypothetical protein [Undibacterium sp. RTI2.1]MEB0118442.1 hypothetical protein [Undibacterium sp. RTI2.2]MEB0233153.1 hypothetical protein [Undibacterium sp. 10I3]MEB0259428.1 hypothetical protein [Undibacterium sp. 5I1]
MNRLKHVLWITTQLWTLLLAFTFVVFIINSNATWMQVKLPLITVGLFLMVMVARKLAHHYREKFSTKSVGNAVDKST